MSESSDNEIGSFLTGFIIGGLVGAAVALIMAPQSGEETRAQIRQRSIEIRDQASTYGEDARRRAEEAAAAARNRAEKLAAEARAKGEEIAERGKGVVSEGRKQIDDLLGRKGTAAEAGMDA
jgi:gas vesicle protein